MHAPARTANPRTSLPIIDDDLGRGCPCCCVQLCRTSVVGTESASAVVVRRRRASARSLSPRLTMSLTLSTLVVTLFVFTMSPFDVTGDAVVGIASIIRPSALVDRGFTHARDVRINTYRFFGFEPGVSTGMVRLRRWDLPTNLHEPANRRSIHAVGSPPVHVDERGPRSRPCRRHRPNRREFAAPGAVPARRSNANGGRVSPSAAPDAKLHPAITRNTRIRSDGRHP